MNVAGLAIKTLACGLLSWYSIIENIFYIEWGNHDQHTTYDYTSKGDKKRFAKNHPYQTAKRMSASGSQRFDRTRHCPPIGHYRTDGARPFKRSPRPARSTFNGGSSLYRAQAGYSGLTRPIFQPWEQPTVLA